MEMDKFEKFVMEKAKGSEFEFVMKRAQAKDPEALEVIKDKGFQRRLFVFVNRRSKTPEQLMKSILYKTGAAIAIIAIEKLLAAIIKKK